ncbi:GntR family transcriptional regulator [Paenibacillus montanisoli]|uniref:GntR family transcriptional regulator n=1 Tax=Paenibacillus montanisoli TaxID=2081970 RepID=A0A328U1J7_9BACL|nr:GntR family transcriptional regulator [Paenibacillus montanisoli]RAP76647.1 GntR family transcriptional regulator [Paenibacillus montanisoli]
MHAGEDSAELKFNSRDPVYLQVVRHFKEEIVTGRLQKGQVIPSRREIAGKLKINPNTAQKAYKEMEEQGLIVTEGNSPSRITTDEQVLSLIRSELITDAVEAFVQSIAKIQVPVDELLAIVKSKVERSYKQAAEEEQA